MSEWTFIALLFIISLLLPAAPIVIGRILGPHKPNPLKNSTYECGVETVGDTWVQFKVQYYIFALIFLIFDVETVFLYPWAAAFGQLPLFAVFEGILFVVILVAGLVYAWRKGALQWA